MTRHAGHDSGSNASVDVVSIAERCHGDEALRARSVTPDPRRASRESLDDEVSARSLSDSAGLVLRDELARDEHRALRVLDHRDANPRRIQRSRDYLATELAGLGRGVVRVVDR